MYLKEAFRYQNYLNEKINLVLEQLNSPSLTTRVVQEHMRTKVNPEADNETIAAFHITQISFLLFLNT